MRLTHLRVKEALAHKCTASRLDYRLNRVYERLLTNGKFLGSMQRLAIAAPYGQLTLPRQFLSVEGVIVNGDSFDIANRWYEFLPGRGTGYSLAALRDLGDGWAVMHTPQQEETNTPTIAVQEFPAGGTLTVTHADTEEHPVTFEGLDATGMVINSLTIALKDTPTACPFSRITRIHKDLDKDYYPVTVTFTDAAAVDTVIAIMEPGEEETYYRRYMIDIFACSQNPDVAVVALCKRRHVEITRDSDIVPINNISAIEKCLDALQYEDENDMTLAGQYMNTAIKILNDALGDANGAASFPLIRFEYPGRTRTYLTSNY